MKERDEAPLQCAETDVIRELLRIIAVTIANNRGVGTLDRIGGIYQKELDRALGIVERVDANEGKLLRELICDGQTTT